MSSDEAIYRKAHGVLLDSSILLPRLAKSDVEGSLRAAIAKSSPGRWSHGQVAVPKKNISLKDLGFEKNASRQPSAWRILGYPLLPLRYPPRP